MRDHSWNFDSHDGSNFGKYKTDAPQAYAAEIDYELPHPTNIPTDPDPLLPCTPAEEIEWAQEKAAAAAAGLPKPDAWCESSVPDPDPVDDDSAATDAATAQENASAEAAANGTTVTPPAAGATAHKKTKAHVPKSATKSQKKAANDKKAKPEPKKEAAPKKSPEQVAKEIVTGPIQEKEVTAAINHDEQSHQAIQANKTKEEKHEIDPNDVVPEAKHDTPKKVKEIMKDMKVEAKKAVANETSKTNPSPTVSKLKADS